MKSSQMTTLTLIRHGETRESAGLQPAHPRGDSVLSDRGILQSQSAAVYITPYPVSLVLTSLFRRAQQSADIIYGGMGVPIFASMALNEYFLRDDYTGAETTEQGLARSLGFIQQFSPYYPHIAVVGHNAILSAIRMSFLNLPFEDEHNAFPIPCTAYILRFDAALGDPSWQEIGHFVPEV